MEALFIVLVLTSRNSSNRVNTEKIFNGAATILCLLFFVRLTEIDIKDSLEVNYNFTAVRKSLMKKNRGSRLEPCRILHVAMKLVYSRYNQNNYYTYRIQLYGKSQKQLFQNCRFIAIMNNFFNIIGSLKKSYFFHIAIWHYYWYIYRI